jgi:hypothetical protein
MCFTEHIVHVNIPAKGIKGKPLKVFSRRVAGSEEMLVQIG